MEYNLRLNFAVTAAVVVIAGIVSLTTSAVVASRAYVERGAQATRTEQVITVKGSTRKRIRSDQAVWHISIRGEHKDLKEAYAILDMGVVEVGQFLKGQGFASGQIVQDAIYTTEHHVRDPKGNETREISAYTLSRNFTITTADVDRVFQAAGEVTQLIEKGVLVISCQPEYYYTDLAPLKVGLMEEAAKDARARADKIAGAAGCRVAEVMWANMGVLQVTQPHSTDVSDYGMYDTATIDKDVQAVVTVRFRVEAD